MTLKRPGPCREKEKKSLERKEGRGELSSYPARRKRPCLVSALREKIKINTSPGGEGKENRGPCREATPKGGKRTFLLFMAARGMAVGLKKGPEKRISVSCRHSKKGVPIEQGKKDSTRKESRLKRKKRFCRDNWTKKEGIGQWERGGGNSSSTRRGQRWVNTGKGARLFESETGKRYGRSATQGRENAPSRGRYFYETRGRKEETKKNKRSIFSMKKNWSSSEGHKWNSSCVIGEGGLFRVVANARGEKEAFWGEKKGENGYHRNSGEEEYFFAEERGHFMDHLGREEGNQNQKRRGRWIRRESGLHCYLQ